MSVEFRFRVLGMAVCAVLFWQIAIAIGDPRLGVEYRRGLIAMALLGAGLGLLLTPYVTVVPFRHVRRLLRELPAEDLFAGIAGFTIGLVMSALLAFPLSSLPDPFNKVLPSAVALVLSYTGAAVMLMRERELFDLIFRARRFGEGRAGAGQLLLDTSSIIDGRIADIARTGFLQGTFVIPRFVLEELQRLADSPEPQKRNRGRHGFDVLDRLRQDGRLPLVISEVDYADLREVDTKLIKLARALRAPIVTTDFNLNRVAEIQGVLVLNVTELAKAVQKTFLHGEELAVHITQEGKEPGQGVGFLEDGTMVVVEGGRRYLNGEVEIVVTRVHQTLAGRMIFAQPKNGTSAGAGG